MEATGTPATLTQPRHIIAAELTLPAVPHCVHVEIRLCSFRKVLSQGPPAVNPPIRHASLSSCESAPSQTLAFTLKKQGAPGPGVTSALTRCSAGAPGSCLALPPAAGPCCSKADKNTSVGLQRTRVKAACAHFQKIRGTWGSGSKGGLGEVQEAPVADAQGVTSSSVLHAPLGGHVKTIPVEEEPANVPPALPGFL